MLQEVIRRRLDKYIAGDKKWSSLPDLMLIDGGKGQLNAVGEVLHELNLDGIPAIGLAKEREEVFLQRHSMPLNIPQSSKALHLLERVRDEAHRFAVGYHRTLRKKNTIVSKLDSIPGIGPKRKKALLKTLGSVSAVKESSLEQIAAVEGMNEKLARTVKELL
jgi:excinuclease ABC subunit C